MAAEAVPLPTPDERITAALWFAGQGFGIFPVWSTRDGRCRCPLGSDCTSAGKHPITPNGFKDATQDPRRIRTFLSAASHPNYGMLPPEGVFIWDVDTDDERARIATLEARYGPLPPTVRIDTGKGQHLFYRWPESVPRPVHHTFGIITRWGSGSGQGYVVGPMSVHASGRVYHSASDSAREIATLPEAWARAAVEGDPSTLTFKAGLGDPSEVQVGGRHDYLRNMARLYAGTVRDPAALFAAVWAVNERFAQPKTREEVQRAIGDALVKFPPDEVEEDPETGQVRRVAGGGALLSRPEQEGFPGEPAPAAFDGLVGEIVDSLATYTDASLVGMTAAALAVCGAAIPSLAYFQREHPGILWCALVGESFVGRKGTTITKVTDAIGDAIGITAFGQVKLSGINSGEGLVSALERRQVEAGQRGRTTALIVEEEYATFMEAAAREHATLDQRLRVAFDMGQLANITKTTSQVVNAPYWLSALIAITPAELREKVPATALRSGSMNRWLFLPIVRRKVVTPNERPILSGELRLAIAEARRVALEERPELTVSPDVLATISEYGEYLVGESVGLAADLSVRFPLMALRMAMTHASLERSPSVEREHYDRGLAMTEYARAGLGWVFGHTIGNEIVTLLLRHLQQRGEMTINDITQSVIRDPVKRQAAVDELQRLGFATVEHRHTAGRPASVLRLVAGRSTYRSFQEGTFVQADQARKGAFVQEMGGGHKTRPPENRADNARKPSSRSDTLHESLHESQNNLHVMHESPPTTGEWFLPCAHYSDHLNDHRNTPKGWVCVACHEALCKDCGAGPFIAAEFHDKHQTQAHARKPRAR